MCLFQFWFPRCICWAVELLGHMEKAMAPHSSNSCLENPMGGGAWWAAVHGVAKSRTRLSYFTFTFHFHELEKEMATHSSILASFVKDKVSICVWIYLWAFYFVPLIYISVFVPVPYCLDDWLCSRAWSQASWFLQFHSSFSRLLWLFEFFLYFHTNLEIICSSSVKNTIGSLLGITLNL